MLCDGRMVCGCADPYAKRVLGDARTSSIAEIWTGPVSAQLRADLNQGGSSFCGDCPLKLPLGPDEQPPQRDLAVSPIPAASISNAPRPATSPATRRFCAPETGITRTPGRHARLRSVHEGDRRSGPDAGPHRFLQLRRGVPAQARRRDVRIHQDEVPAHLSLHEHQRPRLSPKRRCASWRDRASTK